MKTTTKLRIKMFALGVFFLLIAPVYMPLAILWQNRDDAKEYVMQVYWALTFQYDKF